MIRITKAPIIFTIRLLGEILCPAVLPVPVPFSPGAEISPADLDAFGTLDALGGLGALAASGAFGAPGSLVFFGAFPCCLSIGFSFAFPIMIPPLLSSNGCVLRNLHSGKLPISRHRFRPAAFPSGRITIRKRFYCKVSFSRFAHEKSSCRILQGIKM